MISARLSPTPPAGWRWLAGVDTDPRFALGQWERGRAALVRLGCCFDAVRVADDGETAAIIADLRAAGRPVGPVLVDWATRTSTWLVPVRRLPLWDLRGTELLTGDDETPAILMPPPAPGETGGMSWAVRPDGSGRLTCHLDLAVALRRVRPRLRGPIGSARSGGGRKAS
ncbi:hypothetical protein ACFVVU_26895 [Kitasatospora sp. NPDC057965]|uniref:hypothetical protein n=1 Tax=Kitasatospora sp. NPDC057965 TaxID=3346291 RepID=UPI0036DC6626